MNVINLPQDILVNHILPKCEGNTLAQWRAVSKEYLGPADDESLYNAEDLLIKKSRESVLSIKNQIESKEEKLASIELKINGKNVKLNNALQSWFGYFVSILTKETWLCSKIKSLFCWIFPSVGEECQKQLDLSKKINDLINKKQDLKIGLHNSLHEQNQINLSHFCNIVNYRNKQKIREADDKIKDLFGGRKEFEILPILDIGQKEGKTGYIDFIKPEDMLAPIMRGRDKYEREFVTIRAKNRSTGKFFCQTYFRQHTQQANWTSGGAHLVTSYGNIINQGDVEIEQYEALKKFITNKGNKYYTIC